MPYGMKWTVYREQWTVVFRVLRTFFSALR
jgi:hypothetical protein